MSTVIRPETSEKNIYWLPRHRYYELKHFCMQYPDWKKARLALIGMACNSTEEEKIPTSKTNAISDPTGNEAIAISYFSDRINMVEKAAIEADPELSNYILVGITEGLSYNILKARLDIPCCKETYYDRYRRFFWILNKTRN